MKKIIIATISLFLTISFTSPIYGQTTYFRSICQGDTVMYWGNTYAQTGTYNNGSELLYLQVDVLPPTNLTVQNITLCSAQDSLFATCNYNSTAAAYWYVSGPPYGVIYQTPLGSGYHPTQTGTFLAVVTNGCGSDSTFAVVSNCSQYQYTTICAGDSVFFNNQWLTQAGDYIDSSAMIDTILHLTVNVAPDTIVVFSSNSLCNSPLDAYSGSISDSALSISQFLWKLNGNVVGNGSPFQPVSAGTYTVIAYNSCGSDTITYNVNSICTYSNSSDTICAGDSVFFNNQWLTQAGTYRDTIQNGNINDIATLTLTVHHSIDTIVVLSSDPICNTTLYAFAVNISDSVLATSQYFWQFNGNIVATGYLFQPTTTGTYTVIVPNTCGGSSSVNYTVNSVCINSYISDTICGGDSLFFNNQWLTQAGTYRDTIQSGTTNNIVSLNLLVISAQLNVYIYVDASCNTYLIAYDSVSNSSLSQINWTYNGTVVGYGQILNVVTAGTYTAIQYGLCGNDTVSVVVTPCSIDSSDVWAGDADNNGIADNNDLLAIGIGYGISGATRPNATLAWQAEACNSWGSVLLDGTNLKHADCDGNGIINAYDTLAVIQNFGLTHNKNEDERAERSGTPTLNIVFDKNAYSNGDTLVASIQLGDALMPVSDLYGLAFTYNFDPSVIDVSTISFNYSNSWIGNNTDKISIVKGFNDAGILKTAVTRVDHTNRSGYGEIAQFRAVITVDNNDEVYTTTNFITNSKAIDKNEQEIALSEGTDSARVGYKISGINEAHNSINWSLYPNPTNNFITIKSAENIEGIEIYNVLGEKIYRETPQRKQTKVIDVSNLPNGVYIAQIKASKGGGEKRFIVAR